MQWKIGKFLNSPLKNCTPTNAYGCWNFAHVACVEWGDIAPQRRHTPWSRHAFLFELPASWEAEKEPEPFVHEGATQLFVQSSLAEATAQVHIAQPEFCASQRLLLFNSITNLFFYGITHHPPIHTLHTFHTTTEQHIRQTYILVTFLFSFFYITLFSTFHYLFVFSHFNFTFTCRSYFHFTFTCLSYFNFTFLNFQLSDLFLVIFYFFIIWMYLSVLISYYKDQCEEYKICYKWF